MGLHDGIRRLVVESVVMPMIGRIVRAHQSRMPWKWLPAATALKLHAWGSQAMSLICASSMLYIAYMANTARCSFTNERAVRGESLNEKEDP